MKNLEKLKILKLSLIFIFLTSCSGIKENLSLKKKENSDEFLVQKKNPLVLPPDYDSLPKPINKRSIKKQEEKELDLSKIFNDSEKTNTQSSSSIDQSLEDSIRKKIGTN
tara:strand:+ start:783 stop:1112 length:330 start_codon:yes stop_codon:yes gene_type:complete